MPSPLQISLKVVGLDQAKSDLQQFAQSGKRSFDDLAAQAKKLSDTSATTDQALRGVANRVRQMAADLDPAGAASIRLRNALTDVDRALKANIISAQQASTITVALRREHEAFARSSTTAAASTGQMRFALQNLSFQINDIATSLASGGSPMRVLAQQGGQIVQVFQQGGGVSGVLGAAATAIRGMITPTTLAVGGMAALAAGFALVVSHALSADERMRSFTVTLKGMGTQNLATARDLENTVRQLRQVGVAADEAKAITDAIARTPGINPLAASRLAPLALDIAASSGEKAEDVAKRLATAFGTSTAAATKLAQELLGANGLDPALVRTARDMAESGDRAGAAALLIRTLEDRFKGLHKEALGPAGEAFKTIGAAWDDMLTKLGETGAIQGAKSAIIDMLKAVGDAASGKTPSSPTPTNLLGTGINLQDVNRTIRQGIYSGAGALWNMLPDFGDPAANQRDLASALAARSGGLSIGGALSGAVTATANIGGLNTDFSNRLNAWLDALPEQERALVRITSAYRDAGQQAALFGASDQSGRIVAAPGGSAHGFGIAADIRGMSPTARAMLGAFGLHTPMSWEPWHVEPSETLRADQATAAQRRESFQSFVAGASSTGGIPATIGVTKDDISALDAADQRFRRLNEAATQLGIAGIHAKAYWDAFYASDKEGAARELEASQKANQAVIAHNTELQKAARIQDEQTAGIIRSADAFKQSEAAGYRLLAEEQARIEVMRSGGDVGQRTRQILEESAASALQAGQRQVAAALPQISAQERIAEATKGGAAAQHEAELVAAAAARTQDALAKAEASRNPVLIAQAQALNEAALAEERRRDAAKNAIDFGRIANQNRDNLAVVQLETSLQGQSAEYIAAQVSHLQAVQQLLAKNEPLTSDVSKNYLASVDALGQARIRQVEVNREAQRWDDAVRGVVSTIENSLTSAIEAAFSGQKVEDWGTRIKRMLASLVAQISDALFIKPLLGSLAGALGFGNVASSLGTFGNLFGGGGGLFGSGSQTLTGTVGGQPATFNLSSGLQGAGLLKDLFGGSGSEGGLFGGTSKFFGNIGSSLGFASSQPVSNVFGIEASTLNSLGLSGNVTVPGSLFGSTTLGGALGGIGAGFGAGTLLNSLVGGNSTTGTIGSGLGSLAGAAIGSIIPGIGTLIGGLIGGAGGGLLGGLFGNKKPSNQSAGANFDLSSFSLTAGFAGGNSQIDQATQQVAQGVQQFLALLKTTGGALTGNVLLQNGVNTGFTVDSSLPQFSGRFNLGKDPTSTLNTIELALARSLTGISDTMQSVINQISDPAEIQNAIAFATAYDNLKTAADDAFKSVEDAAKTTAGPFAAAMEQIKTLFQGLSDQASRFGLALEPINAALDEATRRLRGDFLDALNSALNEASGAGFINQLQDVYDATLVSIRESQAVGLGDDPATQALLDQVYQAQLNSILKGLDQAQLDQVIEHFTGLNEAIVILAQSAQGATDATADLAAAQELASKAMQARQQIEDYLDRLNATPSTFMSPENALFNSTWQYQQQLRLAQSGDADALLGITDSADALIKNIERYYASSLYGQSLVDEIKQQLGALIGVTPTHQDSPVVITNQLLTEQNDKTETLTTVVSTGSASTVTTITAGTQQLLDSNAAALAATIAQNNSDTATLAAVTNASAAANIEANQIAMAGLIDANDHATASLIAKNDLATADVIAASAASAASIVAKNDATSKLLIAANNKATTSAITVANDNTAEILAGASADATAIGMVMQNVGDEIVQIANVVGNNQITATVAMGSNIADQAATLASLQISWAATQTSNLIEAGNTFADNQIRALEIGFDSLINIGATYSNAQTSAIYGAAGNLASAEAIFANNTITAIATASASNDNLLGQATNWLHGLYDATVTQNDTQIAQLQDIQNKLQTLIDLARLQAAA